MSTIDPVEFGKLLGTVEALTAQVTALEKDVKQLLALADKGRGGLLILNSGFVLLGGLGAWLLEHLFSTFLKR